MKECSTCHEIKTLTEFHKKANSKDGYASQCKACRNTKQGEYRKTKAGKATSTRYNQSGKGKAYLKREYQNLRQNPDYIKKSRTRTNQHNRKRAQTTEYKLYRKEYDNTPAQVERRKRRNTEYRKTEAAKARSRVYMREYRKNNPTLKIKNHARYAVFYAIKTGKIPHPTTLPCGTVVNKAGIIEYPKQSCSNAPIEYHHYLGYSEEHTYDVIAVCKACHIRHHPRP